MNAMRRLTVHARVRRVVWESRMREICTSGLKRGEALRGLAYSTG